jgi:hypothetical protein
VLLCPRGTALGAQIFCFIFTAEPRPAHLDGSQSLGHGANGSPPRAFQGLALSLTSSSMHYESTAGLPRLDAEPVRVARWLRVCYARGLLWPHACAA